MIRVLTKQNRALLRELVITDFKLRYQGSVLGYLWVLLKPLGLFAVLYTVFVQFLKFDFGVEYSAVYLLLGIVLWGYFAESTMNGMQAIVSRGDLLRKIKFPRYLIVVSGTISSLINLVFNLLVVGFFMLLSGVEIGPQVVWFPLILLELFLLSLAMSFFLAAAYVKFRDVSSIWDVLMQGAFYATPILYPLTLIPEKFAALIMLNPMAQIIQDARFTLITDQTPTIYDFLSFPISVIPFVIVLFLIIVTSMYFKRSSRYFAENV